MYVSYKFFEINYFNNFSIANFEIKSEKSKINKLSRYLSMYIHYIRYNNNNMQKSNLKKKIMMGTEYYVRTHINLNRYQK